MKKILLTMLLLFTIQACDTVEEEVVGSTSYLGHAINGEFFPFVIEEFSDEVCEAQHLQGWLTIHENGTYEMLSHEFLILCTNTTTRRRGGQLHWGQWTQQDDDRIEFRAEDPGANFIVRRRNIDERFIYVYLESDTIRMQKMSLGKLDESQSQLEQQIIQNFETKTNYENL